MIYYIIHTIWNRVFWHLFKLSLYCAFVICKIWKAKKLPIKRYKKHLLFSTHQVIFRVIFFSLHRMKQSIVSDTLHKYNTANDSTNIVNISKYYYCYWHILKGFSPEFLLGTSKSYFVSVFSKFQVISNLATQIFQNILILWKLTGFLGFH